MDAMAQGLGVALLAVVAVAAVAGLVMMVRMAASLRRMHEETRQALAGRDSGPALHALVQQTREINRVLVNIDKRLEKLEALEKVQIAHLSFRDEPRARRQ